jgi:hypothetical protein
VNVGGHFTELAKFSPRTCTPIRVSTSLSTVPSPSISAVLGVSPQEATRTLRNSVMTRAGEVPIDPLVLPAVFAIVARCPWIHCMACRKAGTDGWKRTTPERIEGNGRASLNQEGAAEG